MGNPVEIVKALVSPVEKLIDAVQSAIGKAYEPRHIRRIADAKAYEIAKIGQAMRETGDIPIVYDKGLIGMDSTDLDALIKRTQSRLAFQELTKQSNIENVIDLAYDLLKNESSTVEKNADADWMLRFFNSVEDISNEQMPQLWARILAGEIQQPSRFSMRTLDTLKNLTQAEAETFQRLTPYVMFDGFHYSLITEADKLSNHEIQYEDFMLLGECGLLNFNRVLYFLRVARGATETVHVSNIPLFFENRTNKQIQLDIEVFSLTKAGAELFNIVDRAQENRAFTEKLIQAILRNNDFSKDTAKIYKENDLFRIVF